jgi:hypothetical protein
LINVNRSFIKMSKKVTPDIQAITAHLDFLFKGQEQGLIEIAHTPPNSSAVNSAQLFKIENIQQAAEYAFEQNSKEGVNVYVGAALRHPNTPPFGRTSITDYYKTTAVWCDLDDAEAAASAKDKYKDHPPSFVVVTGRHPNLRAQVWWRLQDPDEDHANVKTTLASLCGHFKGDKSVVDPIRIMRLGGTIAWPKKEGRVVEQTQVPKLKNNTSATTHAQLKSYFPSPDLLTTNQGDGDVGHRTPIFAQERKEQSEWSIDDVCNMLNHVHPDGTYLDWLQVGMALKSYNVPFDIWDSWSSQGGKYPSRQELLKKWDTFKGSGVTIGTIYYHAHQGGYRASDYKRQEIYKAPQVTQEYDPETGEIIEVTPKPENGKRLPLLYASDVSPVIETSDFVEDLLRDKEFSVIYGQSNCGKTFFMLDLAMHVALGLKWREKEVEQGGVIYAALEGGHGTRNRIYAFKEHYKVKGEIPLAIIPSSINFLDEKNDMPAFIEAVQEAKKRLGNVRLIVIDTLARAISGGDENSSMDMGRLIINADAIREMTGAHIAFVHHSGKDELKGARGHSSLRAAVDTEIEISRPDTESPSLIKIVKQREMEMIDEMAFSLSAVTLGVNRRGKNVTSCVVMAAEVSSTKKRGEFAMNPLQTFIYDSLIEAMHKNAMPRKIYPDMPEIKCVSYDDLKLVMEHKGFKEMMATEKKTSAEQIKSATQTARLGLKKAGKIDFDKKYVWPILDGEND